MKCKWIEGRECKIENPGMGVYGGGGVSRKINKCLDFNYNNDKT